MRISFVLMGVALVLLDGCSLRYRLQGQGPTAILIPPVPPIALTGSPSALLVALSKARSHPAVLEGCDIENDLLALQWRGTTAEIRLTSESYFPEPGDERPEEIEPRVYLESTQSVDAFRSALEDRVVRGCLRSEEAQALTRSIVERLPFPSQVGQFIRFGEGATGSVDLTPDFRLKVAGPVRSPDSSKEIIGYQLAEYRLTPEDARVKISLTSVSTGQAPLAFPPSSLFYRLLFRTANSPTNHLATILGAKDEETLNNATRQFEAEQNPSCAVLTVPGLTCVTPPPEVSVNLEFPVSVNRHEMFVPLGGNLSSIVRSVPGTLRIRRLFRGRLRIIKFDHSSQSVLRFALMPHDEITW